MMTDMNKQSVPGAARRWWPALVAAPVLAAIVLALFRPTLSFQFVNFDDDKQVVENPFIRSLSPENLGWIFTHFWITSYYPVRLLSFAIDYHFWGLDPEGYHLTNVLLHAANVLLVFWLMLRLMAARRGIWQVVAAAAATAIFAVHPVVVEPVAWIPGREELLMTLFALLCLHFHRSAHLATKIGVGLGYHALAAVACAAAAMSNVVGAAVPLIVLAYDVAVARPKGRRAVIAAAAGQLPLWAITAAAIILKEKSEALPLAGGGDITSAVPWLLRPAFGLDIFRLNLMALVWPQGLTPQYMRPADPAYLSVGTAIGLACALAMLALVWLLRRERTALLGILWFLVALAPTSQIIPHHIFRADRFLYLPLAGLAVAVGTGLAHLAAKGKGSRTPKAVPAKCVGRVLFALAVPVAALAAVTSVRQLPIWQDGLGLFEYCVATTPDNPEPHDGLGVALVRAGRLSEAVNHYRRALELAPSYPVARCNLGIALLRQDRIEDSIQYLESAIRLDNHMAMAHANLGVALMRLGRLDEAEQHLLAALRDDPYEARAHDNLGVVLLRLGRPQEAVREHEEALRLDPKDAEARSNLGTALLMSGRAADAVAQFNEALRLDPGSSRTWSNCGGALIGLGRPAAAVRCLQEALRLDPESADAYSNLGRALLLTGRFAEAAAAYERVIAIAPDNPRNFDRLARLLATCPDDRVRSAARALQLAERASRMTGDGESEVLDTLAAAYAEAGDFDRAVATADLAAARAAQLGRTQLAETIRTHRALFQERRPLRETPGS